MKMMTKSLMFAILMLASVAMIAQKSDKGELKDIIQDYNNKMVGATLNGDYGKLMTYYDEKVISLPNYNPMMRGLDEVMAHQQESAAKGNKVTAMKLTTKKVSEKGDVVIEIGSYTITVEIAGMAEQMSDKGKYMTIWRKTGKDYRILYEMWNTDINPMSASKKGSAKGAPDGKKGSDLQNDKGKTRSGKKPASTEKKPTSTEKEEI